MVEEEAEAAGNLRTHSLAHLHQGKEMGEGKCASLQESPRVPMEAGVDVVVSVLLYRWMDVLLPVSRIWEPAQVLRVWASRAWALRDWIQVSLLEGPPMTQEVSELGARDSMLDFRSSQLDQLPVAGRFR